jgi:hypothetical protein
MSTPCSVAAKEAAGDGFPPDADPGEGFYQLLGPLVTAAMMRPEKLDDAFADRVVKMPFASRGPRPICSCRARHLPDRWYPRRPRLEMG